jgi:two-component system sensor histidine kinase TctE
MLGNLIENAILYGKLGGAIDVSVTPAANGTTVLEVRNDGDPIPEAMQEQVFERFQRVPGSPGNGCGLGLAIVRDVARMHGATVKLRTNAAGNTFSVAFNKLIARSE